MTTAVYPPEKDEGWAGAALEWANSQWDLTISTADLGLIHYTGLLARMARWQSRAVHIGGIGGVKTHPDARGRGYASEALDRAVEFFRESIAVDFGLLVCDDRLVEFYEGQGWHLYGGSLFTHQLGKRAKFTFNRVMVRDITTDAPTHGELDLQGPPW